MLLKTPMNTPRQSVRRRRPEASIKHSSFASKSSICASDSEYVRATQSRSSWSRAAISSCSS